nr:tumor necrosis factor receptor superfamily member 5 [Nothobranchius furzeri]
MTNTLCSKDQLCPAGKYMEAECKGTQRTVCGDCTEGSFTATQNALKECRPCTKCITISNRKQLRECTSKEDTVCECVSGYYCSDDACSHCQKLTTCPLGQGVKIPASRTSDAVCALCEVGTYSNVTDYRSPCVPHTRCEDIGKEPKTRGNSTTDAVCGNFRSDCSWVLPAGLWAGLVLTIIIVAAFIFWRTKRRSHRTACPVDPVRVPLPPAVTPPKPISHCQETCIKDSYTLSLFNTDGPTIICSTEDSSCPITPLKASVSFVESPSGDGSIKCSTGNFCRLISQPQEDEWCGAF